MTHAEIAERLLATARETMPDVDDATWQQVEPLLRRDLECGQLGQRLRRTHTKIRLTARLTVSRISSERRPCGRSARPRGQRARRRRAPRATRAGPDDGDGEPEPPAGGHGRWSP